MVEIMFAILILGVVLGLLIGSVKMATRMTKGAVDRQAVNSIRTGVTQFKQLFGMNLPLVRERSVTPVPGAHTTIQTGSGSSLRNHVCVYQPTELNYMAELRGGPLLTALRSSTPNNPFIDYRYSEHSIPYYLVGQLDIALVPGQPIGPVIDGVRGAGFCKPLADGSFAIPADLLRTGAPTANATSRTTGTHEPLIHVNANSPKLLINPDRVANGDDLVMVTDRNNIPIRYYRWEPEQTVSQLTDLNVPALVARKFGDPLIPDLVPYAPPADRDLEKSPNIKGATFAIVAAGPDGFFGDEDDTAAAGSPARYAFERMMIAAGFAANDTNVTDIVRARVKAEEDNIVEVGQ